MIRSPIRHLRVHELGILCGVSGPHVRTTTPRLVDLRPVDCYDCDCKLDRMAQEAKLSVEELLEELAPHRRVA